MRWGDPQPAQPAWTTCAVERTDEPWSDPARTRRLVPRSSHAKRGRTHGPCAPRDWTLSGEIGCVQRGLLRALRGLETPPAHSFRAPHFPAHPCGSNQEILDKSPIRDDRSKELISPRPDCQSLFTARNRIWKALYADSSKPDMTPIRASDGSSSLQTESLPREKWSARNRTTCRFSFRRCIIRRCPTRSLARRQRRTLSHQFQAPVTQPTPRCRGGGQSRRLGRDLGHRARGGFGGVGRVAVVGGGDRVGAGAAPASTSRCALPVVALIGRGAHERGVHRERHGPRRRSVSR